MWFIVIGLAVWRVVVLLQRDDGPYNIFKKFRERFVMDGDDIKDNMFAKGFGCFYCLSVWVSFLGALILSDHIVDFVIYSLALSGFAIIVDRAIE